MEYIVTTIQGVFNNSSSLLKNIKIIPDKVTLLSDYIISSKKKLCFFNSDLRIKKDKYKIYMEVMPELGLQCSIDHVIFNSSDFAKWAKKPDINNNFILLTSENIFRNYNNVVFTTRSLGLQESDIRKLSKL